MRLELKRFLHLKLQIKNVHLFKVHCENTFCNIGKDECSKYNLVCT